MPTILPHSAPAAKQRAAGAPDQTGLGPELAQERIVEETPRRLRRLSRQQVMEAARNMPPPPADRVRSEPHTIVGNGSGKGEVQRG
ncbi:hypothetical protein [Ramlibacter sp. AN1133]|uniref:hypothetical protein n=1 Tax=Ramlibacter sp. AN1133 TaxID=3133429 RepID=UPI0030C2DB49